MNLDAAESAKKQQLEQTPSSVMDLGNESDTAQMLGSNIARRGKRAKRGRNQEHANGGHSMTVLSEPETLTGDDETRELQRMRLRGLSGSLGDSLPSVRAQLAAGNIYAESSWLHRRSTKETTPLLTKDAEKGGVSNDSSSSDSVGLNGKYDAAVEVTHPAATKGERVKKALKKWQVGSKFGIIKLDNYSFIVRAG